MQQMRLCGRCAELLRDRYIVRLEHREINQKIDCDCCKRHQYGALYQILPKRSKAQ